MRFLLVLVALGLCVACSSVPVAPTPAVAPPQTVQPHIDAIKQQMLAQLADRRLCFPVARLITNDSYVPFGVPEKIEGISDETVWKYVSGIVEVGRYLEKQQNLQASVVAFCKGRLVVGEQRFAHAISILVESAGGYSAMIYIPYEIDKKRGLVISQEFRVIDSGLVFKREADTRVEGDARKSGARPSP